MSPPPRMLNILLADDDKDDCLLFKEALDELKLQTVLTIVHDGDQLMQLLTKLPANRHRNSNEVFDLVFLDHNMPRKNGFECLEEIKSNHTLNALPVVIFSTSYDQGIADKLYKNGVQDYLCKPASFFELRKTIHKTILQVTGQNGLLPPKENFLPIS